MAQDESLLMNTNVEVLDTDSIYKHIVVVVGEGTMSKSQHVLTSSLAENLTPRRSRCRLIATATVLLSIVIISSIALASSTQQPSQQQHTIQNDAESRRNAQRTLQRLLDQLTEERRNRGVRVQRLPRVSLQSSQDNTLPPAAVAPTTQAPCKKDGPGFMHNMSILCAITHR